MSCTGPKSRCGQDGAPASGPRGIAFPGPFQLPEATAFIGLWPHPPLSEPARHHSDLCFRYHISFSDSSASLFPLLRTPVIPLSPPRSSRITLRLSRSLTYHICALPLAREVTYSQILGIRMGTSGVSLFSLPEPYMSSKSRRRGSEYKASHARFRLATEACWNA